MPLTALDLDRRFFRRCLVFFYVEAKAVCEREAYVLQFLTLSGSQNSESDLPVNLFSPLKRAPVLMYAELKV